MQGVEETSSSSQESGAEPHKWDVDAAEGDYSASNQGCDGGGDAEGKDSEARCFCAGALNGLEEEWEEVDECQSS